MKKILLAATIVAVISLGSCYNDKFDKVYPTVDTTVANPCDTTGTISFATTIQPILTANCSTGSSSCHSAGSSSGLDLTTWTNALKIYATRGTLVDDINFGGTGNDMPKGGTQLSSCNINKITRWAHQGGLNN